MNAYKTANEAIEMQRGALISLAHEAEAQVKAEAAAARQISALADLAKMVESDPLLALIREQAKLDEVVVLATLEAEEEAARTASKRPGGFELGLRALEVLNTKPVTAASAPKPVVVVTPTEEQDAARFLALMQGHEKVESRGRDRLLVDATNELALKERRLTDKETANKAAAEATLIELGFDHTAPGFGARRKALTAALWTSQEAWAKAHKKFEGREDSPRPRNNGKGNGKGRSPRNTRGERAEKPEGNGGFEAPEAWKDETPVVGALAAQLEAAGIVPAPAEAPVQ